MLWYHGFGVISGAFDALYLTYMNPDARRVITRTTTRTGIKITYNKYAVDFWDTETEIPSLQSPHPANEHAWTLTVYVPGCCSWYLQERKIHDINFLKSFFNSLSLLQCLETFNAFMTYLLFEVLKLLAVSHVLRMFWEFASVIILML